MRLPLEEVREDMDLQLRTELDMDRVKAMVEFEEEGGHLPPITVVGDDNLLGDGHHRLAAARRQKRLDIEAERVPGGKAEAIVIAIRRNDISTTLPLTRDERNVGIKWLLVAGWTQERIAEATGASRQTIGNIGNALAQRGQVTKREAIGKGGKGGKTPKPVAVLPPAVHEQLDDTVLYRIAALPEEQQVEFATAVAAAKLPEPRVREAIKALREDGLTPTAAVEAVTPIVREMPLSAVDIAKQVRRRLERFLSEEVSIQGKDHDFWSVLDVLVDSVDVIPLEARGLAGLLSDIAVKADKYASLLRDGEAVKALR